MEAPECQTAIALENILFATDFPPQKSHCSYAIANAPAAFTSFSAGQEHMSFAHMSIGRIGPPSQVSSSR